LLKDSESLVKLKTAIALANARDKEAVPVVMQSLADLPPEQAAIAEEFLSRLAGDDAPAGQLGADADARKKRAEAWTSWWKDKGSKSSLAVLLARPAQERYLGFTMV